MIKLGEASAQTTIAASIDSIDISDWLFGLTSAEYAACASGHQSAAQGQLPSGKRVSINAEQVAGFFMVQHYVETISERDRVSSVSPNTVLWLDDERFVLLQITWELYLQPLNEQSCQLTCTVISETENEPFAQAMHARNQNIDPAESAFQLHIEEETPLFAKDIERKALTGRWL